MREAYVTLSNRHEPSIRLSQDVKHFSIKIPSGDNLSQPLSRPLRRTGLLTRLQYTYKFETRIDIHIYTSVIIAVRWYSLLCCCERLFMWKAMVEHNTQIIMCYRIHSYTLRYYLCIDNKKRKKIKSSPIFFSLVPNKVLTKTLKRVL